MAVGLVVGLVSAVVLILVLGAILIASEVHIFYRRNKLRTKPQRVEKRARSESARTASRLA